MLDAGAPLRSVNGKGPRDRRRVDRRVVHGLSLRRRGWDSWPLSPLPRLAASAERSPRLRFGSHNELVAGGPKTQERALEASDAEALEAFAASARRLVEEGRLSGSLGDLVRAVAGATGATLVVARIAGRGGSELIARAVHADSPALAAELQGSRLPAAEVEPGERAATIEERRLPPALRRAAERTRSVFTHVFPIAADGSILATLELFRAERPFSPRELRLARLAAFHVAAGARLERTAQANGRADRRRGTLELLGEALAAGADEAETAEQIVRLAAESSYAAGASLWRVEPDGPPTHLAAHGLARGAVDRAAGAAAVEVAVEKRSPYVVRSAPGGDGAPRTMATIPLGEPPVGGLQLFFQDDGPGEESLALLSPFAARAALALRRSRRVGLIATALLRSQTVIGVVSQAIAHLSLAHTLETAVERIAELTSSGHVAIYLREGERLTAAAARGLEGAHTELADRLLELALGPFRGRGFLFIEDMRRHPHLRGLEGPLEETGVRRALLIPLVVHDEVIGALGVFKTRPRPYREGEEGLLIALSSQLAVAVQNARLHERTKELGTVLERTLVSERRAARQLRGLYEISHSFAESLSLEATLTAVAKTMVELFGVDAAAIRMPDERGDVLEARAVHVADPKLRDAAALLSRPQPLTAALARRLLRSGKAVLLRPGLAKGNDVHRLLEPFLEQGATAAVLPLATPGETLGTLTLLSLDPTNPLDQEAVDSAMTVARQAALAIDNARLYQQQKDFAETMQRSLLPQQLPAVPGLAVGHVYESSAGVDVGGDLYDFMLLEDGRLAVVLGDVTGKGIEAAADMAMAKFSFRALARQSPEPSALLASANSVVVEEIGSGKFITMLCVLVDPSSGEVASACAGHPPARVVGPDGSVSTLGGRGLALGIDGGQTYESERAKLEAGSTVVLFTDGVIEARRDGELYGEERLDALLVAERELPPQALAEAIVADCTAFAHGELGDDCAVVCIRLAR
jgi:serine phosphatase RsbU (regulator of sigma subunit)